MPEEVSQQTSGNSNSPDTSNPDANNGSGSSPNPNTSRQDETAGLKAQLQRLQEDLERERETSRLLQTYAMNNQQHGRQVPQEEDEYKDVEKALGPYVERKLKPYVDRITQVMTDYYDKLDGVQYHIDLLNSDPEFAERLDPGIKLDEIDRYRLRVAQSEGRYVSRSNALGILKGMRAITEEKKSRLSKRQQAQSDEAIRQTAAETANSGIDKPDVKPNSGKNDQLLAKFRSGGKLTDEERSKVKDILSDVAI